MNGKGVVVLSLCVILILRLVSMGLMGLMPQDAYYYYVYGEHLSYSYYDHPPLVGYMLRLFKELFGKSVFTIKLADTVISALTIAVFYKLSLYFLSPHQARKSLVLLFSTLMVTILSLVSTPDVPLLLFWCLSLIMLYNAIFKEKKIYWIWSGLMMGLAFDSKYTGIMLPAGLILFLLCSNEYRKKIISWELAACFLVFGMLVFPVVFWNVHNDFASFRFQSEERVNTFKLTPLNFAGLIGHQAALLTPILLFFLGYILFRAFKKYILKKKTISPENLFLFSFFVPLFLGFIFVSFFYWVKLNWMMPAYITGILLAATYFSEKWIRYQVLFSLVIHVTLAVEIFFYPIQIKSDDTWFGWKELAINVNQLRSQHPGAFIFSADNNKTSSILNFYSDSMVFSNNIIGENALHFDYIGSDLKALKGRDAIFLNSIPSFSDEKKQNEFPKSIQLYFDEVSEMNPILIRNNNRPMRKFLVFYCTNYHPDKNKAVSNATSPVSASLPIPLPDSSIRK